MPEGRVAKASQIPLAEIETLFLDVGNTLVSIDFEWVSEELERVGIACSASTLRRQEAAGRPHLARRLAEHGGTEGLGAFGVYLDVLLDRLEAVGVAVPDDRAEIAAELARVLRAPGQTQRLWSSVLPGVPEALAGLREHGLQLVVVSNSDGTVEDGLEQRGLRGHFDAVVDSHVVGFEKPDPRIFEHALEVSGATRGRTLHVGDLYFADVLGARSAGLHALLLDPYDDWPEMDCPRLPGVPDLYARIVAGAARDGV